MTPWMILGRWYGAKSRVQPEIFFSNAGVFSPAPSRRTCSAVVSCVHFVVEWNHVWVNDNKDSAPQMALLETQRYQDHLQSSILTTIYGTSFPQIKTHQTSTRHLESTSNSIATITCQLGGPNGMVATVYQQKYTAIPQLKKQSTRPTKTLLKEIPLGIPGHVGCNLKGVIELQKPG